MNERPSASRSIFSKLLLGLLVTGLLGAAFVAWGFVFHQDLAVTQNAHGTFIDVRWLGEYQANARGLRLTDVANGTVVWELRARKRFFPLWLVSLRVGENPPQLDGIPEAEVVVPRESTFRLTDGKRYRVDLWTYKEGLPRHATVEFVLESKPGA